MIDQHGWSAKDWDELNMEQRAIQIASLQYWSDKRREAHKKATKGEKTKSERRLI